MWTEAAVLRHADEPPILEAIELPDLLPDELLVTVAGTGLCHTDVLAASGRTSAKLPIVLGHEGAGVVTAVGEGVTDFAMGEHVVLSFDHCGRCRACSGGHPAYCSGFLARNMTGVGVGTGPQARDSAGAPVGTRWFGQSSLAAHSIVHARSAVKVGADLPIEMMGPLGCGVQTGAGAVLCALDVRAGTSVVVFGTGSVGLSAVLAAVVAGATTIIAVDVRRNRLELAESLGATHAFCPDDGDVTAAVRDVTGGGADVALDTTGVASVVRAAVQVVRPMGSVGLVGVPGPDIPLDPSAFFGKHIVGIIEGDVVPRLFIPRLIDLWRAGRFPFDRLVTTFPLDQLAEAEAAMAQGSVVKPVLVPGNGGRRT